MKNLLSFLTRRTSGVEPAAREFVLFCAASGQRWPFRADTYEALLSSLLLSGVFGLRAQHAHRLAREVWDKGKGGTLSDVLTIREVW